MKNDINKTHMDWMKACDHHKILSKKISNDLLEFMTSSELYYNLELLEYDIEKDKGLINNLIYLIKDQLSLYNFIINDIYKTKNKITINITHNSKIEIKEENDWDLNISLKELIEYNPICKVDREYKRHKSDNCYNGYCLYMKHPNKNDYSIMIGINDTGFSYLGDGCIRTDSFVNTKCIMSEMFKYLEYIQIKNRNIHEEEMGRI